MRPEVSNPLIAVIIPAYNEGNMIAATIRELLPYAYTIIVVDDGSTDNTKDITEKFPVYYLRHVTNLGQGAALQTGLSFAQKLVARYFVSFDADGQHSAKDIQPMIDSLIQNDLEVVFGSRFLGVKAQNMSRSRFVLLKLAIWVNYFFSGIRLSDAHNGFRVMSRSFIEKVALTENGMAHATEIMAETRKKDLRYGEYPTQVFYTPYSQGKGQRNIDGFKTLQSIILSKIFTK